MEPKIQDERPVFPLIKQANDLLSSSKKYSLVPDMITGWKPNGYYKIRSQVDREIPLKFDSPFDSYFQNLIE